MNLPTLKEVIDNNDIQGDYFCMKSEYMGIAILIKVLDKKPTIGTEVVHIDGIKLGVGCYYMGEEREAEVAWGCEMRKLSWWEHKGHKLAVLHEKNKDPLEHSFDINKEYKIIKGILVYANDIGKQNSQRLIRGNWV